jgi:hypothetical protein
MIRDRTLQKGGTRREKKNQSGLSAAPESARPYQIPARDVKRTTISCGVRKIGGKAVTVVPPLIDEVGCLDGAGSMQAVRIVCVSLAYKSSVVVITASSSSVSTSRHHPLLLFIAALGPGGSLPISEDIGREVL